MNNIIKDGFRVSPYQTRVWTLSSNLDDAFNCHLLLELTSAITSDLLISAIKNVVDKHELLRTSVRCPDGHIIPLQYIEDAVEIKIERLSIESKSCSEEQLKTLIESEFDCNSQSQKSPLEVTLLEQGEDLTQILLRIPSIYGDGQTLINIWNECLAYYYKLETTEDPFQYADVAEWLHEGMETEEAVEGKKFWNDRNVVAEQKIHLLKEPQDQGDSWSPKALPLTLSGKTKINIKHLADNHQIPASQLLLSCWAAYWSIQNDVSNTRIGTLFSSRTYDELMDVCGGLANYLPLQTTITDEDSIETFSKKMQSDVAEMQNWLHYYSSHQEVAEQSYYSLGCNIQECDFIESPCGFAVNSWAVNNERFDIQLTGYIHNDAYQLELAFNEALLSTVKAERVAKQFEAFIEQALTNKQAPLKSINFLSQEEKSLLLTGGFQGEKQDFSANFSNNFNNSSNNSLIHEMVEYYAANSPEAIAVRNKELTLTYGELNARANQVANYLIAEGIGENARVGLLLRRSELFLVGILGVLKTGAAYVPVDPEFPQVRIEHMISDAQVSFILTQANVVEGQTAIFTSDSIKNISLDSEWSSIEGCDTQNVKSSVTGDSAAYLIYTSGSTGNPKGVVISHASLTNYVNGVEQRLALAADDTLAALSTIAADLGHTAIFGAICTGRTLSLLPEEMNLDAELLAAYLEESPIDCLKIVPSHLSALLSSESALNLLPKKLLVFGGEALDYSLVQRVRALAPSLRIINHYGPSETTVGVLSFEVAFENTPATGPVVIGRPMANSEIYVLDQHQQPLAIGLAGELYVGGAGLAIGYWDQKALTNEKFISPVCEAITAKRLYATGDRVRFLADGSIEYLGRTDDQIKVRGHRIEVGEIERAILKSESVTAVTVKAFTISDDDKQLAAYVVAPTLKDDQLASLCDALKALIPDTMIPSQWIILGQLPLNKNGKVDKKALPEPDWTKSNNKTIYVAPSSETEKLLATIWQDILNVEIIGINDDFFEVGGHSLLATRVVTRVRKELNFKLEVRDFFANPTINALSQLIKQTTNTSHKLEIPSRLSPLPLSYAQKSLWVTTQLSGGASAYNICSPVELKGALDSEALQKSLQAIVDRHEVLRTNMVEQNDEVVQLIHASMELPFTVTSLEQTDAEQLDETIKQAIAKIGQRKFDLANDPLIEASLFVISPERHVLVLNVHHIVTDGWSFDIIIREFVQFYQHYTAGLNLDNIAPLPMQYGDYTMWQLSQANDDSILQQLDYWQQQLADLSPTLDLPLDFPRPSMPTFNGAREHFQFDSEVDQRVKSLCLKEGASLFMTTLAAFQLVLSRFTGQSDITIGSPIANRTESEFESLIGFFVNTLVLRGKVDSSLSFSQFLQQIKETTLAAYENQDVPFDQVSNLVNKDKSAGSTAKAPLYQVRMVMRNQPMNSIDVEGVQVTPLMQDFSTAKFDLLLILEEGENGLQGSLEYNTSLFRSETINRIVNGFKQTLDVLSNNPEVALADIEELFTEKEVNTALELMQREQPQAMQTELTNVEASKTVAQVFEKQVNAFGEQDAIVFNKIRLTYAEFNAKANCLANTLIEQGIKPQSKVAILLPRNEYYPLSMFACLKAGAIFIPVDNEWPIERIESIVQEAKCELVISQSDYNFGSNITSINLALTTLSDDANNPNIEVDSNQAAYILYTSGSTGVPKGVEVSHRNLLSYLQSIHLELKLPENAQMLAMSTMAADLGYTALFGALCSGRCFRFFPVEFNLDANQLADALQQEPVTCMKITPSHLEGLLTLSDPAGILPTECLLLGGERLMPGLVSKVLELNPDCRIINHYGPTESTIGALSYDVSKGAALDGSRSVPIGKPLANSYVYILDNDLKLVPQGVAGELYIGGEGVSLGYFNRDELTEVSFLNDPFSHSRLNTQTSGKIYRTGDRVRQLIDGNIEFVGRMDEQVKIRGYRVEPGEIATIISNLADVVDVCVLPVEHPVTSELVLAAYIVGPQDIASTVIDQLSLKLPQYMVPSLIEVLDKLPLTANGKVDHKALPEPSAHKSTDKLQAPRDEVEEALVSIWQSVLGLEKVSVNANFYQMGGDSIKALQIIAQARKINLVFTPQQLFNVLTISQVADLIETPYSSTEQALLAIAREVLNNDAITRHDLFLKLGGDSIKALQIIACARQNNIVFTPSQLLEYQSIAVLSRAIVSHQQDDVRPQAGVSFDVAPFELAEMTAEKLEELRQDPKVADVYPASPVQQGMLYHCLAAPEEGLYFNQVIGNFSQGIDIDAFSKAFEAAINRHDILRTSFLWGDVAIPHQVVAAQLTLPLIVHNWQEMDKTAQNKAIENLLEEDRNHHFELDNAPLLRVNIIHCSEREALVVWSYHHLLLDGWCLSSFISEILADYQARIEGQALVLAKPASYRNYIAWLAQQDEASAKSFWSNQLAGVEGATALPIAKNKTGITGNGRIVETLDPILTTAVSQLAQACNVTLNTIIQSAWTILLSKYSGQKDVVFGATAAGRPVELEDSDSMLGLFINTLPIRQVIEGNANIAELTKQIQTTNLAVREFEYTPLKEIKSWSQVAPNASLFDSIVVFENYPIGKGNQELQDKVGITIYNGDQTSGGGTGFPLTLMVIPDEECRFELIYEQDKFEQAVVADMLAHFTALLHNMVNSGEQGKVSQLSLMTPVVESAYLKTLTTSECATSDCNTELRAELIHQTFEAKAAQFATKTAVSFDDVHLTYAELNAQANQLANLLRDKGVSEGDFVGICMERSHLTILAIIAILKAGAVYVPVESTAPQDRISYIFDDAKVKFVLTESQVNLPFSETDELIYLNELDAELAAFDANNLNLSLKPNASAYVIYTSGTTGQPKGVVVSHNNVSRLFSTSQPLFNFTDKDVWTLFHSYAFDFSVWEIWGALLHGGHLVVVPYWISRSSDSFYDLLLKYKVTVLNQTPSAFKLLNNVDENHAKHNELALRYVIFGGEALESSILKSWTERHALDDIQLINMYGITETTVHVTYKCLSESDLLVSVSNIGKALPDLNVYVLDEYKNVLPAGVCGELYVGGTGVAKGYLGKEELTKERFIDHSLTTSSKLYRSGDLAKYNVDGDLEYLGRIDQQVKIRGFRIELGEIEACLLEHEKVKQVVVVVKENSTDSKQLVAYIVGDVEPDSLKAHASSFLPDYMVPSLILSLDALPLTINGKVDVKALPNPMDVIVHHEDGEPQNELQRKIAQVWKNTLNVTQVGIHDNFFELGGDSIVSLQIVSRLKDVGLEITPKQLFETQTILAMSQVVTVTSVSKIIDQLAPVVGHASITPIQHWFFGLEHGNMNQWNQSQLFKLNESIDLDVLKSALDAIQHQHDSLRSKFSSVQDKWQQEIQVQTFDVLQTISLEEAVASGGDVAALIKQTTDEIQTSLSIENGPIWRVAYINLGEKHGERLFITCHHLVIDGVSWRILLDDLFSFYNQAKSGQTIELQAKSTSVLDWSHGLAEYAMSSKVVQQLGYWKAIANNSYAPIPQDFENGSNTVDSTERLSFELDIADTTALLKKIPEVYRTRINDILLTALSQTLCNWMDSETCLISLEGHGRELVNDSFDVSRTVGWFTNLFPVALPACSNDMRQSILSIKEHLRSIPNNGIGYGALRYLHSDDEVRASLVVNPEITFNYLGQFDNLDASKSWLSSATEEKAPNQDLNGKRHSLIDVGGAVFNGKFQITWSYSNAYFDSATIEKLGSDYIQALKSIVLHCQEPLSGGVSPSDYPLLNITQSQIDTIQSVPQWRLTKDAYPLSPMQEGILFHERLSPDESVYFNQLSGIVEGELDIEHFKNCWQKLIERHDILRTRFIWEGIDAPVQLIEKSAVMPITIEDWQTYSSEEQQEKLEEYLTKDRASGFDFQQAPLMRVALIQLSETSYYLVWSRHHLLLDGWCTGILMGELLDCYNKSISGQDWNPGVPRPFSAYIEWLQNQDMSKAESFWRSSLAGIDEPTALPMHNDKNDFGYNKQHLTLPVDVTAQLQTLAKSCRVTMNTLVQAAWSLLLGAYSGQKKVLFGSTTSGRPADLAGVEQILGLFINTLPVPVALGFDLSLKDWLQEIQQTNLNMREFEYSPLSDVQQWSEIVNQHALFHSLLVFENFPTRTQEGALDFTRIGNSDRTNYPLALIAVAQETLSVEFCYQTGQFTSDKIEQMMGHLSNIFIDMLNKAEESVGALSMLSKEEREQCIHEWNQTSTQYPENANLANIFEQQVAKDGDATALHYDEAKLSYSELNEQANQLAHWLHSEGVDVGEFVGVALPSSIDWAVTVLAIIKLGATYVPLDPSYPAERLRYIAQDAELRWVIGNDAQLEQIPAIENVIFLAAIKQALALQPNHNLECIISSNTLAYITYTSGTTGQPKGVMVPQKGVLRLVLNTNYVNLQPQDNLAQLSNTAFDAVTFELWGALLNGGTLVDIANDIILSPVDLAGALREKEISVLFITGALFNQVVKEVPDAFSTVSTVIVGGEALEPDAIRALLASAPPKRLLNGYGPTENTTFSVCHEIKQVDKDQKSVPIGRPIANSTAYILDINQQPVPVGVKGELYLGGDGLALGYLNQKELTQQKFIKHPFSQEPSAKLYRTGDLAQYLPSGDIEYLGRVDHQVKIRGFRIELGEVESVLQEHESVHHCILVVRGETSHDKQLVAYAVSEESGDTLKAWLQDRLPEYMVPTFVVILDTLPLTSNGKLDRAALPAIDISSAISANYEAPVTNTEKSLHTLWSDILKLTQVSVTANFFELGGHSLLATRLVSAIRQSLSVELPLKMLFEKSTIRALAEEIDEKLGNEDVQTTGLAAIESVSRTEDLPLSFAQQRLWFIDQMDTASANYNMPMAIRFQGNLNIDALQRAFDTIIARHESLRTVFKTQEGQAVQVILEPKEVLIPLIDLPTSDSNLEALVNEHALRSFDLSTDLMLRVTLVRENSNSHVILFNMHHIASDGWSMSVLISEFTQLYKAYIAGDTDPLTPLNIQYADYAHWQRQWLNGSVLEQQLSYWEQKLNGLPPLHDLPLDYSRPAEKTYHGAVYNHNISGSCANGLNELSKRSSTTLFMTLQAAFSVLLSRYSNETDIVMGTPVAGRTQAEVESLIGFFVNTLVLRLDLDNNPSFDAVLAQARQVSLDAFAHQHVPFEMLVENLQPERSLSYTPLFQIMFVLQNNEQPLENMEDISLSRVKQERTLAKFDLTLTMSEQADGLSVNWEYNRDLFAQESIEQMAKCFTVLLDSIIKDSAETILCLPMMNDTARQVLVLAGQPKVARDFIETNEGEITIHQKFEQQVQLNPQSVALSYDGITTSYGELNAQANQLAHKLIAEGVNPDDLVGLCFNRSADMIIGMLAVLKAGGAYVPLDPAYPKERLHYMVEDAQLSIVITDAGLVEQIGFEETICLCTDTLAAEIEQESSVNPLVAVLASNLAYVIYTSGSTGQPKGVLIEHQNVLRLFTSSKKHFNFNAEDAWTLFHSFSFDFAVWETWGALIHGARLVNVSQEISRSPDQFVNLLIEEGITVLNQTPSAFYNLLEHIVPCERQFSLRYVVFGGEALEPMKLLPWFERFTDNSPEMINMYGITETTVHVTYRRIHAEHSQSSISDIGVALEDLGLYVCNAEKQLLPMGMPGELYVGGAGLARGYLNRPEMTNERFVKDFITSETEGRLYRTGDYVRLSKDGALEYLGRTDEQVKVRGFRIELGEIQNQLIQHENVADAVVVVRSTANDNKFIVAYIILPAGSNEANTDSYQQQQLTLTLKQALLAALPEYMVPTAFVYLPALPLTQNGKINRHALPAPDLAENSQGSYEAPVTTLEQELHQVWSELLNIGTISVTANFFELGGHSLLASRLASAIRTEMAQDVSLKTIFSTPTIRELAAQMLIVDKDNASSALTIQPVDRSQSLPLSFSQQRMWFIEQMSGTGSSYNMPMAVRFDGQLNLNYVNKAINEIIKRHEILRTTYQDNDGELEQIVQSFAPLTMKIIELNYLDESEKSVTLHEVINAHATETFALDADLMIRALVVKLTQDSHVLMVNMHHIASDGWSMNILLNEFASLYESYVTGSEYPLLPLAIQYSDFAFAQRTWLTLDARTDHVDYWANKLANLPKLHSLPLDNVRPATPSSKGQLYHHPISASCRDGLVELSRKAKTTLFMTLQAAFSVLISRYSNESDIVMGTPIAGRTQSEIEPLIGFFINTLVLRNNLSGEPSFTDLLAQVKTTALEAFEHQSLPFEMLVETLDVERSTSHSPVFQIMFALQNNESTQLQLPDLTIATLPQEHTTAKFDLTLNVIERESGLETSWEYNSDLFDHQTIERMAGHFDVLLQSIIASPEQNIETLPMITSQEKEQLVYQWNETSSDYPSEENLASVFEQIAVQRSEHVAVKFGNDTLTYSALNRKANQLANWLLQQEYTIGEHVGLSLSAGADWVVALLAIIKTGRAYVPLDLSYPEERLNYIVQDANIQTIIGYGEALTVFEGLSVNCVCLKAISSALALASENNLTMTAQGTSTAYIIYTSGTTGKPKGAVIPHQAVNRLVLNTDYVELDENSCIAQLSNIAFDAVTFELWGALLNGGKLVGMDKNVVLSPVNFAAALRENEISALFITGTLFAQVVKEVPDAFVTLCSVLVGGDVVDPEAVRSLQRSDLLHNISNLYGPTENTTFSVGYKINQVSNEQRSIPIGRPIANSTAYILDKHQQPVPVGVIGELYLGGDGLAKGYLNRDDLNATVFVNNPFVEDSNARMYRSGDLARFQGDGNIDFVGRTDHQVKIRGFRIELGEIEAVLNEHSQIKDCIVVVSGENPMHKKLVAYVVAPGIDWSELKTWFKKQMPHYMLPDHFIEMVKLPLNINGKVDRKALPELKTANIVSNEFIAPRTEVEMQLAIIWQEVLQLEKVSMTDSFFDLGGHSLIASQVVGRVRKHYDVEMTLENFFSEPSIENIAKLVESQLESFELEEDEEEFIL
ncbi:non-ribosomal peptide synthase/polyketide synthase [Colwellia sp. MB02u-14]|uniref:non-ribosomal peptide synthase/polyketide synthase n=1 Tax=Colwellia sp. MB02u-14 TaxID=2759815 RepID=UPI0015F4FB19|nr:non-ribosomal peptide synthase/polyketide synthase [Colwellia sp. MB02u-14]MBA6304371.1 non-ribosomal peptide synthase/polyketide synthase [Colwellia sp. MB02u-14]